jgi:hydrogenase expression/formation protein HypC
MCLGIPGQIVALEQREQLLGIVEVGGIRRTINLACIVDEAHPIDGCIGEWVLIHVGFALCRIDAEQAAATLALLRELDEAPELDETPEPEAGP